MSNNDRRPIRQACAERSRSTQGRPPTADRRKSPISNLQSLISDPYLWLTLLLSLPVIGPLLQPGYLWGAHDARHSVYFLFEFNQAIQDGILYPRWAPNFAFGYGYPFFNIYGPLSSYAGELFYLSGFDFVSAVKIVLGLSAILSGLTMYLFVRHLLGRQAGLIAALLYVYLPYHLFDLYVRAALAESVAFVFVPLVMWAFYLTTTRPTLSNVIWGAVAYAALIFTHNSLGLLFIPVMGVYVLVMLIANPYPLPNPLPDKEREQDSPLPMRDAKRFFHQRGWGRGWAFIRQGIPPAAMLILALGLSAVFLLPAIIETQYVRVDQWTAGRYAFGSDFVETFQLFSPRWGFGSSIPGPNDDTGFQIGLAAVVLFILSFITAPKIEKRSARLTIRVMQGVVLVIAFLSLSVSGPVWQILSPLQMAQFPWRLLFILAPAIAVVGGSVVSGRRSAVSGQRSAVSGQRPALSLPNGSAVATVLPLALLILLSSFPYLQAEIRDPKPTEGPVSLAGLFRFQQSSDELTGSTAWVKKIPTWSPLADTVIAGEDIESRVVQTEVWSEDGKTPLMGVDSFEQDSVHEFVWVFTADDEQAVTFYIPYYPGWTATIYEDTAPDRPDLYPDGRIGRPIAQPEIQTTDPEGWMVVPMPAGSHFLELRFNDTPVRVLGKWISIVSLLVSLLVSLHLFNNPE